MFGLGLKEEKLLRQLRAAPTTTAQLGPMPWWEPAKGGTVPLEAELPA